MQDEIERLRKALIGAEKRSREDAQLLREAQETKLTEKDNELEKYRTQVRDMSFRLYTLEEKLKHRVPKPSGEENPVSLPENYLLKQDMSAPTKSNHGDSSGQC